jgi:hypothetical protein
LHQQAVGNREIRDLWRSLRTVKVARSPGGGVDSRIEGPLFVLALMRR